MFKKSDKKPPTKQEQSKAPGFESDSDLNPGVSPQGRQGEDHQNDDDGSSSGGGLSDLGRTGEFASSASDSPDTAPEDSVVIARLDKQLADLMAEGHDEPPKTPIESTPTAKPLETPRPATKGVDPRDVGDKREKRTCTACGNFLEPGSDRCTVDGTSQPL